MLRYTTPPACSDWRHQICTGYFISCLWPSPSPHIALLSGLIPFDMVLKQSTHRVTVIPQNPRCNQHPTTSIQEYQSWPTARPFSTAVIPASLSTLLLPITPKCPGTNMKQILVSLDLLRDSNHCFQTHPKLDPPEHIYESLLTLIPPNNTFDMATLFVFFF